MDPLQKKGLRKFLVLERNASMVSILSNVSHHNNMKPLYAGDILALPLHSALQRDSTIGDLHLFVELHSGGLTTKDAQGNLPLHIALLEHCSHTVIAYLARECPWAARVKNADGYLPLHLALLHKTDTTPDTIELLLQLFPQGVEVESKQGLPLAIAIVQNLNLSIVQLLVQVNPCALTTPCLEGNLPLHLSVASHNIQVVDWLASVKQCTLEACNRQGHSR
jgi:ankyrin repeat protein